MRFSGSGARGMARVGAGWLLALLGACGGGGSSSIDPVGSAPVAPSAPFAASAATTGLPGGGPLVSLRSERDDYIGDGRSYDYDTGNAAIRLRVRGSYIGLSVQGAQRWTGDFQLPGNLGQLQAGTYPMLTRFPFQALGDGAMSWSGESRGCNMLTGSITIESVAYQAGILQSLAMSFEQFCDGATSALRGQIRIDAAAMAQITLPRNPLPDAAVLALQSDVGDYIGAGGRYAYDHRDSFITVTATGSTLLVRVEGDQRWDGAFQLPASAARIEAGDYPGLSRYPFPSAGAGTMEWRGEGRGCNALTGRLVINSARYTDGVLSAVDLDFVQHCEGGAPALRGQLRWDAERAVAPAGPLQPVPAGLWSPPDGTFPASGNAMFIVSSPGDYIGQGWTWWVGAAAGAQAGGGSERGQAAVSVTETAGLLRIELTSTLGMRWVGEFTAPRDMAQLTSGYYGIVQRFPFHNPARGGMNWTMESRGCNRLDGWFAIDSIRYEEGRLRAVDLRFTQFCDNALGPLRGRVRWDLAEGSR